MIQSNFEVDELFYFEYDFLGVFQPVQTPKIFSLKLGVSIVF
jgi:hypothetical protein